MSFDERAPSSTPLDQNKLQETSNTSPEASRLATGVVQSPSEARKDCCDGALTQNTEQASSSSSSNEPSAEQLLESGKAALRLGEVESAVEKFSESVEKKLKELGLPDGEKHPSLGPYYLEYGNALLKNAENSNELFQLERAEETAEQREKSPEQTDSDASESVSDEQLAWEILELARICYSSKLDELEKSSELPNPSNAAARRVVEDAAFVHLRLGDLLTVEEQFVEATEEFRKSLDLLLRHQLPYSCLLSSHIALGQAQLFSGQVQESLSTFKTALKLVTDQLNGVDGGSVPSDRLEDFKVTQEDITIQIAEIERIISQGEESNAVAPSSSSSSSSSGTASAGQRFLDTAGIKTDLGHPSRTFAPSQLKSEYGETVLGVVEGKRAKARAAEQQEQNTDGARNAAVAITTQKMDRKRPRPHEKKDRNENDDPDHDVVKIELDSKETQQQSSKDLKETNNNNNNNN